MCFSATASFTASAGLALVGGMTARFARNSRESLLAGLPFLFSVQQMIEGMLWILITRSGPDALQQHLTTLYIIFVGVAWPVLSPLSLYLIEPLRQRRNYLAGLIFVGCSIAACTLYMLLHYTFYSQATHQCIVYHNDAPIGLWTFPIYVLATCAGFFISSLERSAYLGIALLASFFVAYYFYALDLASVWCFLAAILSSLIYVHFRFPVVQRQFETS